MIVAAFLQVPFGIMENLLRPVMTCSLKLVHSNCKEFLTTFLTVLTTFKITPSGAVPDLSEWDIKSTATCSK